MIMLNLSASIEELSYLCFNLNPEISQLVHKTIWLDPLNRNICVTLSAMEKIMYYLEPGYLNDRLQSQIDQQFSNGTVL